MSDTNETEKWRLEDVAEGDTEIRRRHEENRKAWNEGAVKYGQEIEASREFLVEGKSNIHPSYRVGGGVTPAVLSQNRAYGSVRGSSCHLYPLPTIKPMR